MFLTQQHIAIAKIENGDVSLVVVNIQSSPHDITSLNDVEPECEFLFPDLSPGYRVADVMFRSDPGPEWTPNPKLQVPFHISRKERLFIITVSVQSLGLGHVQTYAVFVPTSTLLRAMDSFAGAIEWTNGVLPVLDFRAPAPSFSDVWVCYVHGMSFASFLRGNRVNHRLFVLDFNQLAIRKAELEGRSKDTWQLLTNPTIIAHNAYSIFAETVETALPLRFRAHEVKWDPDFDPLTVMISEDAIILVERTTPSSLRRYRILTF
ncbi:hypothetical protein QCA50_001970 [Cerrena zonata]|uniref:DUF1618 domain-containing protein n=1 Tax=Cerrena zonata TaxID=2478898 RepID=A0AAW0GWZ7_9APHY